jgi:predicted NUDIX family phosphoesterase
MKGNPSILEQVLAVPSSCLWDRVGYVEKGLITDGLEQLTPLVARCGQFLDRQSAEADTGHKQLIPYAVIRYSERYFLLQRKSTQGEKRLHNKLSIGVGGHINPAELQPQSDMIGDGLAREVNEELFIAPGYRKTMVGLINDDTTEVGRVHLGILFEIDSVSFDVRVRETHKMDGAWALLDHVERSYEHLETWSQIVFDSYLYPRFLRDQRASKAG